MNEVLTNNLLSPQDEAERGLEGIRSFLQRKYGSPTQTEDREGRRLLKFSLPDREIRLLLASTMEELVGVGVRILKQAGPATCASPGLAVTLTATGTSTLPYNLLNGVAAAIAAATAIATASAAANLWAGIQMLLAPPGVCLPGCQQLVGPAIPPPPGIVITPSAGLAGWLGFGSVTVTVNLSATISCV